MWDSNSQVRIFGWGSDMLSFLDSFIHSFYYTGWPIHIPKPEQCAHHWEYENEFKPCSFRPCGAHILMKGEGPLKKEVRYNLLSPLIELYTDR